MSSTPTGATRLAADREHYRTGLGRVIAEWPETECADLYRLLRALNERIETPAGHTVAPRGLGLPRQGDGGRDRLRFLVRRA